MKRRNIGIAFTFDRHFDLAGLRSIPQSVALFQPVFAVRVGTPCAESHRAIFAIDSSNTVELTSTEWHRRHAMVKFSETVLTPLRPLL